MMNYEWMSPLTGLSRILDLNWIQHPTVARQIISRRMEVQNINDGIGMGLLRF